MKDKIISLLLLVFSLCSCESLDNIKDNGTEGEIEEELEDSASEKKYYSIPESLLNGWDEGFLMLDESASDSNVCMLHKKDTTTDETLVYIGTAGEEFDKDGLILYLSSTNKFKMMRYLSKTYLVEQHADGGYFLSGYDDEWNLVEETDVPSYIAESAGLSTKATFELDAVYSVWQYGCQVFSWENNSDRINTALSLLKDIIVTGKVVAGISSPLGKIVASTVVDKILQSLFDEHKQRQYMGTIPVITNIDTRNNNISVEICNSYGYDLPEGTFTVAVAGRKKHLASSNRADYTHAEYRTQTQTITSRDKSVTLTLAQNLEVGDYVFTPYILADKYNDISYITVREWFVQYGGQYNYSYPNPILSSKHQNFCRTEESDNNSVEFEVDIHVQLDNHINVEFCRVLLSKEGKTIGYNDSYMDSSEHTDNSDCCDVKVNVTGNLAKKHFKDNTTMVDYSIIVYGDDGLFTSTSVDGEIELSLSEGCPDDHHVHAIDLGLSVKWACCNVGASKPEEYGGLYAWGETETKSVYNEVTYKYCHGIDTDGDGWYEEDRYYDNLGSDISNTQYDVAHVKWGGSWRMPTAAECRDLIYNCTSTWTDDYNGTGVNGRIYTSRINGNSIFLPAAGHGNYGGLYYVGSYGNYCSSTFCSDGDGGYAWGFYFGSDNVFTHDGHRWNGQSVRPVTE